MAGTSAPTPATQAQDTSRTSLDDYLSICASPPPGPSDEEVTLAEFASVMGEITERMEAVEPPEEVSAWHDAAVAYMKAVKKALDGAPGPEDDEAETEYIVDVVFPVAVQHQPAISEAIADMNPDVRARMVEATCIDEETSGAVPAEPERTEVPVGGSVDGELAEADRFGFFQFEAVMGQNYFIDVAWEGFPDFLVYITPRDSGGFLWSDHSTRSPIFGRWTAPESGTFHVEVNADEGAGTYVISISRGPDTPGGVSAAWEGETVRVSWEPAEGAEYYRVYHDGLAPICHVSATGKASQCSGLAKDVTGTTYVHGPSQIDSGPLTNSDNYYWVSACNSSGCTRVDSDNSANPDDALPDAPGGVSAAWEGSAVRVSWEPVEGAEYYEVFFGDSPFPDRSNRLATDVTGTTYVHANPTPPEGRETNYYWVVSCNSDGCSRIGTFSRPASP